MKMILFLDDDPVRHARFKRWNIGCLVTFVKTYEECVAKLTDRFEPFDEVHLDHDLSEHAAAGFPAHGEKTGTDVAQFIAQMPKEKWPDLIVIHSFNEEGRRRMGRILREAGHPRVMLQKFGGAP